MRKVLSFVTGNFWYEAGDHFTRHEFLHTFLSVDEIEAEFAQGGLKFYISISLAMQVSESVGQTSIYKHDLILDIYEKIFDKDNFNSVFTCYISAPSLKMITILGHSGFSVG